MFIYIVGISRRSPLSTASSVRARVYSVKPVEADSAPPALLANPGGTEFSFQVEGMDVALWTEKIGTYAEFQSTSFS